MKKCFWCKGESVTRGVIVGRDIDGFDICKPCATVPREDRWFIMKQAREFCLLLSKMMVNEERLNYQFQTKRRIRYNDKKRL